VRGCEDHDRWIRLNESHVDAIVSGPTGLLAYWLHSEFIPYEKTCDYSYAEAFSSWLDRICVESQLVEVYVLNLKGSTILIRHPKYAIPVVYGRYALYDNHHSWSLAFLYSLDMKWVER